MTLDFYLTSLIVVLVPGTGVVYTISQGLFRGPLASVVGAFGCTLGILPHIAASLLGIAALLHTSAIIFQTFKFIGVAYLFYLAWGIWRESGTMKFKRPDQQEEHRANLPRICLGGFLINILNPKLSIFFLAFLPQFVPAGEAQPLPLMIGMSAIFMGLTLGIFILYGLAAAKVSAYVTASPTATKWIQRSFAGAFAAFGAKLALTD
ncbi:MAG: LysE family translocator [Rhodospirillaceae bacterium]|jgi:threonine/homoserine/homoserine lactone efflux protein|nr:LysE family translocator [Rhodospirillaceae bacterium]MBT4589762.1 LysE family translocator [Rhodospirillaceae bacterium]MBT4940337.1 LysE family translocator [Rhodospirillaceae bacterium]MBT5940896.1 LysE family translocator [Rhodospirillaceae bacterium]MBT7266238.1 LysE family translocator [Rhodospirillaceae bacterium]